MIQNRALVVAVCALMGVGMTPAVTAGPAEAATTSAATTSAIAAVTTTPATSVSVSLSRAFEVARDVPAGDVSGIRPGTLHVGSAGGQTWAIATFTPAKGAGRRAATGFQDGAATGVFTRAGGAWRLVQTGLYGCADGLPAVLKVEWHLSDPTVCGSSLSVQKEAADQALAGLPTWAQSAASSAGAAKFAGAAEPARTANPAGAAKFAGAANPAGTSTANLGQKIAAIALRQVGVSDTPTVSNFNGVDCDPYTTLVAGFSADSDGCGYNNSFGVENENETWCADFNKWVWEQAGITTDMNTLNAGAVSFYDWALEQGQSPQLDTGTPEVGDSIVFFSPGNFPSFADHVGIVTSVSSNGTIDMVNGDFAATPDVHVEYDTGITNLSTFAASVEGAGEEWLIVAPPTTAQEPAPTGRMWGPQVAVTGTTGSFHAFGTIPGGSVADYYWTFGDGRTTNATGASVTHVFSEAGTYTVSVTITSSYGTVVTLTRNVRVLSASSGVASVPYDGIYYDPLPILQYVFTRSADGLAVDSWDGGSWLQSSVPGSPSATGNFATLSYPDAANADAMTPHAFYRSADGSLAETYLTTSGWMTDQLPGNPAAGGTIAATTTASGGPAVYFIDAAGNLAESVQSPSGWTTAELLRGGPAVVPSSLALADTAAGADIFGVGPSGTIRVFSSHGDWPGSGGPGGILPGSGPGRGSRPSGNEGRWLGGGGWYSMGPLARTTPDGPLVGLTTPDGQPAVVYVNVSGSLAEDTETGPAPFGNWYVTELPGTPATGSTLAATTYLLPSVIPATPGSFPQPPGSTTPSSVAAPLGTEAFFMTASGSPAVSFNGGAGWQTATLTGTAGTLTGTAGTLTSTATSIAGASAYQVEEEPSNLFLSGPNGLTELTTGARSGDPSGPWTSMALPTTPATWADRVVLYAADPADTTAAQAAATAAGLPASQVVTSFATAWADTLSGEYLVIVVGGPAVAALYFNVCGWANPSALPAGSTPFSYVLGPTNTLPGADVFVSADGETAASTQALATDLAYYALNGTLPAGVTSLPAAVGPPYACVGSPS